MPQFVKNVCPIHGEQIHRLLDPDDKIPSYECLRCEMRDLSCKSAIRLAIATISGTLTFVFASFYYVALAFLSFALFFGIVGIIELILVLVCWNAATSKQLWKTAKRLH